MHSAVEFVATREGGVDRNAEWAGSCLLLAVATREGGVDRNLPIRVRRGMRIPSPPARVAWIETQYGACAG